MIISVTERGTFKRCRYRWDVESRNRKGLTPLHVPKALNIGTMVHSVGELWLQNPEVDMETHSLNVVQEALDAAKARYRAVVGAEPDEAELESVYEDASEVMFMMKNYQAFYGKPLPDGYTLVQTEQTIIVPIPGTEHPCEDCNGTGMTLVRTGHAYEHFDQSDYDTADCSQCEGKGIAMHFLEATLDGVIRDEYGRYWVYERKTYGQKPKLETLQQNDQFRTYAWVLTVIGLGETMGVLYDGLYKKDVTAKRPLESLFTRYPIVFSQAELLTLQNELRREAFDMDEAHHNPEKIYRNIPWQGCWDCSGAKAICQAEYAGDDVQWLIETQYTKRESAPWLEAESDDGTTA